MKKLRILHIAQAAGGVERYIQMLLKNMDNEKIENSLICSNEYTPEKINNYVNDFEQIEMQRSIGFCDFKAVIKIRKLIKKYKPDIVYAHSSKAGALARMANVGLKSKCIYNPHGWAFNMQCSPIKQILYTAIEKILAPMCEKIICISEAEKESALKKKICKEKKLHVIFNGIDIQFYEKNRLDEFVCADLMIADDAFVVGMVGRISPQKAPDIFIRAAEIIKKNIPNAFFVIVGDGEQRDEIIHFAEEVGLSKSLMITGWVDEPMKYIKQFDVAMLMSRWEGFGLVLAEYMLAEKPIVATRVDAIPNIITSEKNGLLVDVDDYVGAAEAVISIHNDKSIADKYVECGIKCVRERFDIKRVAQEHMELFWEEE